MSIQPLRRDPRLPAVPRSRPGVIPAPKRASSCVVVDELGGAAPSALEALRGRDLGTVVVLARRAEPAEVSSLLSHGARGAVVATERPPEYRAAPGAAPDLSVREIGVLRHVAQGCSNREVGDLLGLSALTVKSHLARISRKLGTGDRAQLVAIALRGGLLD